MRTNTKFVEPRYRFRSAAVSIKPENRSSPATQLGNPPSDGVADRSVRTPNFFTRG
jgi:hypothetical protein